jgi:hypothetical protein
MLLENNIRKKRKGKVNGRGNEKEGMEMSE